MRRVLILAAGMSLGWVGVQAALPAHAATHGCIVAADAASITSDPGNPVSTLPLIVGAPCTFTYVTGDGFTGAGIFKMTCQTSDDATKTYTHAATDPLADSTALDGCMMGGRVTIDASGGGVVVAGNPQ